MRDLANNAHGVLGLCGMVVTAGGLLLDHTPTLVVGVVTSVVAFIAYVGWCCRAESA